MKKFTYINRVLYETSFSSSWIIIVIKIINIIIIIIIRIIIIFLIPNNNHNSELFHFSNQSWKQITCISFSFLLLHCELCNHILAIIIFIKIKNIIFNERNYLTLFQVITSRELNTNWWSNWSGVDFLYTLELNRTSGPGLPLIWFTVG